MSPPSTQHNDRPAPTLSGHVPRRRRRARRALVRLRLLLLRLMMVVVIVSAAARLMCRRRAVRCGGGGGGCGRRARSPDADGGIVGDGGKHGRVDGIPAHAIDGARVTDQFGQRFLAAYVPDVDLCVIKSNVSVTLPLISQQRYTTETRDIPYCPRCRWPQSSR